MEEKRMVCKKETLLIKFLVFLLKNWWIYSEGDTFWKHTAESVVKGFIVSITV